jgi:hypothetical protein
MPAAFDPDDAAVRALVHQILDRPAYAAWHARTSPLQLFRWLGTLYFRNPVLFWLITATLTLLLVLIVAHVAWTIRRGLATRPSDDDRARAPDATRSFVDDAAALAERGRYLDASRAVQLGAIALLVRTGRIRLGRGDPNRVLRRRLGEARIGDTVRTELLGSIASLERRWFRDREEDEALYRRWRHVYGALAAEVAQS